MQQAGLTSCKHATFFLRDWHFLAISRLLTLNTAMTDQKPTDQPTDVPGTDVPGTKAVAIKRASADSTPTIVAKGHGFNAEKILDIAFAEGVKVRQDRDLTELLDAFEVDCPVPLEALHAVSLILDRVYSENKKMDPTAGHDTSTHDGAAAAASAGTPLLEDGSSGAKGNDHG
jgi:flagellar biosynthesis protein